MTHRLVEERRARKLSAYALAKKSGVTPTTICDIERGRSLGSIVTRRRLLLAMEIPLDQHEEIFGPLTFAGIRATPSGRPLKGIKCLWCGDPGIPSHRKRWLPFCSRTCAADFARDEQKALRWCDTCGTWEEAPQEPGHEWRPLPM